MIRVLLMFIVIKQIQANLIEDVSSILHIKNKIVVTTEEKLKPSLWIKMAKSTFARNEVISINSNLDSFRNKSFGFSGIVLLEQCPYFDELKISIANPWVIFSNDSCQSNLSQPVYTMKNEGELWEQYNFKETVFENHLGTFDNESFKFNAEINANFYKRRGTLSGIQLKVMSDYAIKKMDFVENWQIYAKETEIIKDAFEVTGLMTGPMQDYLDIFAKEMNFTYKQFKRKDGKWAYHNKSTNEWTGVIRNLQDNDVDFLAAPFSYDTHRHTVIDYMFPLLQQQVGFAIRSSDINALNLSWDTYTKSYSLQVWILIIISMISSTLVIFFIFKTSVYFSIAPKNEFTFSYTLWICIGSFFGIIIKDANVTNIGRSGRFALLVIFLLGNIFYFAYQAAIVSRFSIPSEKMPFNTPKELLTTKYLVLTDSPTSYLAQSFSEAKEGEPFQKIFVYNMDKTSFYGYDKGATRLLIRTEPYITFYGPRPTLLEYAKIYGKPCSYRFVWFSPVWDYMAFAFPKESPLRQFANELYPQIRESGLMNKMMQDFSRVKDTKCDDHRSIHSGIPIQKFASSLILLAIGIIASILTLNIEFLQRFLSKQLF